MINKYEYLIRKAEETGLKGTLDVFLEIIQTYREYENIVREAEDFISTRPKVTSGINSYF